MILPVAATLIVCIPLQTEKELSKLMSRAMKEGLEGLVMKDVNVMATIRFIIKLLSVVYDNFIYKVHVSTM